MHRNPTFRFAAALLPALLMSGGCASVGPMTVSRDRFDYSTAITESWKRQTLLNIVKLRYLDPPIFVDVGQIVAGYQFETAMSVGATLLEDDAFGSNSLALGGSGRFTDRPTITYTPLTGNRFVTGLMTPFRPESIFSTIEAGWPADAILFASLRSINGLNNQSASVSGIVPAEPDFLRALELMRKIQSSGSIGFRMKEGEAGKPTTILTFNTGPVAAEVEAARASLRQLLRLDGTANEFRLVSGHGTGNPAEIAIVTRSMMQVMGVMASEVEVPPQHVTDNRTMPGLESVPADYRRAPLIRIQSAVEEPADSHVAVPYRDHWFYIDDRDLKSKRVFAFLMLLFTMADTGERENLPVLTIPTQ